MIGDTAKNKALIKTPISPISFRKKSSKRIVKEPKIAAPVLKEEIEVFKNKRGR